MPSYPSSSGSTSLEILPDSPNRFYYCPPGEDASHYADHAPQRSDAVHVHGRVRVRVKEPRLVKQLLVRFRTTYQIDAPDCAREEGVLLERTLIYGQGESLSLEAGDNHFDYLFVLGNHLPSATRSPWGRVSHHIEAQVNGLPAGRFGGLFRSPPSTGRSLPQVSPSPELLSVAMASPSSYTRPSLSASRWTRPSFFSTATSSSVSSSQSSSSVASVEDLLPDGKWLTGSLATSKQVFMIPVVSTDTSSLVLDHSARPAVPDLALWPWSLHSPRLVVGGRVDFDCTMVGGHPLGRVHMIKLHLIETITLANPARPDLPPKELAPLAFLLALTGGLPGTKSKLLWEGADVPFKTGVGCEELSYAKQCDLPDESRMRRSTLPGTLTPVHVKHEFRLQVYFDIWGEDLRGNPLPTGSGPGEMRLATMTHPVFIAGCCTGSRVQLPTYGEATSPMRPKLELPGSGPLCSCGNAMGSAKAGAWSPDAARTGALGLELAADRPKPARRSSSNASGKWEYEAAWARQ